MEWWCEEFVNVYIITSQGAVFCSSVLKSGLVFICASCTVRHCWISSTLLLSVELLVQDPSATLLNSAFLVFEYSQQTWSPLKNMIGTKHSSQTTDFLYCISSVCFPRYFSIKTLKYLLNGHEIVNCWFFALPHFNRPLKAAYGSRLHEQLEGCGNNKGILRTN